MKNRNRNRIALPALLVAGLAGCDAPGTTGPDPARAAPAAVTLSFAVADGGPRAPASLAPATAGEALVLESVELLLREVELKRVEHAGCDGDDACEEFESGPALVSLPLGGGVVTPFSETIAPGTYDELELRVREPEDDDGARARFRAEHPEWPRRASVRVRGSFDSGSGPEPFDVFLEVDARVERALAPPLVVDAATDPASINVTLAVQVHDWFRTPDGRVIDPRRIARDRELADDVAERIEASLEAFRDDDRNGHGDDDHGRGGHDDGGDDTAGRGSEFEGRVGSVDLATGSFTLGSGTRIRVPEGVIDAAGDLHSLQAVADAVAAGREVEAEGRAVQQSVSGAATWVATTVEFEWDGD